VVANTNWGVLIPTPTAISYPTSDTSLVSSYNLHSKTVILSIFTSTDKKSG